MRSANFPNILVAPLDWGLGHTTRCIPLIKCLLENDANVILAGNQTQRSILQESFPGCKFLNLKGYGVNYSKSKATFAIKLLKQAPQILSAIKYEHEWIKQLVKTERIDGIISDNRFGCYDKKIPSAFVTHQLLIKNGLGKRAESMLQHLNYQMIEKFSHCWVPDFEGSENLGGELSHPEKKPKTSLRYIGPLSRMELCPGGTLKGGLFIALSGPEPQRSLFERILFEQLKDHREEAVVVRGLPRSPESIYIRDNIKIYNHLNTNQFNAKLCKAEFVICRSGYSSVMDLNAVRAKSILVATPGQTEQEYLASYLAGKNFSVCESQDRFNLTQMLAKARKFSYSGFTKSPINLYEMAVKIFLEECRARQKSILR